MACSRMLFVLACAACAGCSGEQAGARLRLSHPDARERLAAIAALERRPEPGARNRLLRMALSDPDTDGRRAAAALLEAQEGDSLEALALAALDRHPDTMLAGMVAESGRESLRVVAVSALRRLATPTAWACLARRMGVEPAAGVRSMCVQGVVEGVSRGAGEVHGTLLAALRRGLGDREEGIRRLCARALASAGDPAGVPILVGAFSAAPEGDRRDILVLLRTATGEDLGEEPRAWRARFCDDRETEG